MKKKRQLASASSVDHPPHYSAHASSIECIEIAEHMNFCLGNVIKYVWRAGEKGSKLEDLKKARWYLDREIARLEKRRRYVKAKRRKRRRKVSSSPLEHKHESGRDDSARQRGRDQRH